MCGVKMCCLNDLMIASNLKTAFSSEQPLGEEADNAELCKMQY